MIPFSENNNVPCENLSWLHGVSRCHNPPPLSYQREMCFGDMLIAFFNSVDDRFSSNWLQTSRVGVIHIFVLITSDTVSSHSTLLMVQVVRHW